MKFKILSLALLTFISTVAFSQFSIGFKAGANINKLSGTSFKEGFSFGYQLGGFVEIPLNEKFSIQPEVLFNQSNVDTSNKFNTVYQFKEMDRVQLKYLSIPLLLNFKPTELLTLQAGPQFGILLNKDRTLLQNGKQAFKGGDFSILGGMQLNLSPFIIYGRYVVGLSNLNDIDNKEKWHSQGIQLGVGLKL